MPWEELETRPSESSSEIRQRVEAARRVTARRPGADGTGNSDLSRNAMDAISTLEPAGRRLLATAVERLGLSVRALHRSLNVARTIASLAGAGQIAAAHVAEALSFRRRIGEE